MLQGFVCFFAALAVVAALVYYVFVIQVRAKLNFYKNQGVNVHKEAITPIIGSFKAFIQIHKDLASGKQKDNSF